MGFAGRALAETPESVAGGVVADVDLVAVATEDVAALHTRTECCGLPTVGPDCLKSRYVSFTIDQVSTTGCSDQRAVRVTFVELPGFEQFNGEHRWLGAPGSYPEVDAGQSFSAAALQCAPHFDNFGAWQLMHVFGPGVVPGATYEVETADTTCPDLDDPSCYSDPLVVTTGVWGGTAKPFHSPENLVQPDFRDIAALVQAFAGEGDAPITAQAQLQPNVLDPAAAVDFRDVSVGVGAFLSGVYPFDGPDGCL